MKVGISVITSVYCDEYLLQDFIKVFEAKFIEIGLVDYEVIVVDDGSDLESIKTSRRIVSNHKNVQLIELTRNFGQHIALAAALDFAQYNVVVRCNLDLQDSLSEFQTMYNLILSGNSLVIGVYRNRNVHFLIDRTSRIFYRVLSMLSGSDYHMNTSSLRFYDEFYTRSLRSLKEHNRLPQALDSWLGFKPVFVSIDHFERFSGKSSYNFQRRLQLAVDAIFYFSNRPIKFLFYSGILFSVFSFFALLIFQILSFYNDFIPGYASIISLISLGIGLQALMFGILGIYVSNIFNEVRGRPLYLVKPQIKESSSES
jgi:dolichol-phosphate mannosyltransferase